MQRVVVGRAPMPRAAVLDFPEERVVLAHGTKTHDDGRALDRLFAVFAQLFDDLAPDLGGAPVAGKAGLAIERVDRADNPRGGDRRRTGGIKRLIVSLVGLV